MGTMLKYGSEGAKQFYEMYVLDPKHAEAHITGDIHIHDLDFLTLTTTCCQIDLTKLFEGGFSTGHGFIREPKRYSDLCGAGLYRDPVAIRTTSTADRAFPISITQWPRA